VDNNIEKKCHLEVETNIENVGRSSFGEKVFKVKR